MKASPDPDEKLCFSLWQSVIVTYGKCFTENKAGLSKLERVAPLMARGCSAKAKRGGVLVPR